jgi:hypothetical protein
MNDGDYEFKELPVGTIFAENYRYTTLKYIKLSPKRYTHADYPERGITDKYKDTSAFIRNNRFVIIK